MIQALPWPSLSPSRWHLTTVPHSRPLPRDALARSHEGILEHPGGSPSTLCLSEDVPRALMTLCHLHGARDRAAPAHCTPRNAGQHIQLVRSQAQNFWFWLFLFFLLFSSFFAMHCLSSIYQSPKNIKPSFLPCPVDAR